MNKNIIIIISCFLAALTSSAAGKWRGDLNADGKVDLADMVFLAKAINSGNAGADCDLNLSGKVDDFDLETLANIILSGKLVEDEGFNVGIGGWDDSGEDYGGIVKAPAFHAARQAESTRFYIDNSRKEGEGYAVDFGIGSGEEAPVAVLFNIQVPGPSFLYFDKNNLVNLDNSLLDGHRIYGNVRLELENIWSEFYVLRFILFSPDLKALKAPVGKLGSISYSGAGELWFSYLFSDCQMVVPGTDVVYSPDAHDGWIWWIQQQVLVQSISIEGIPDGHIMVGDRFRLRAVVSPEEASNKSVVWGSSDQGVASIDSDGNVEITGAGSVAITAVAADGGGCEASVVINAVSGVDAMFVDEGPYKVFNLNGCLILDSTDYTDVMRLPRGVYIVRSGATTRKLSL